MNYLAFPRPKHNRNETNIIYLAVYSNSKGQNKISEEKQSQSLVLKCLKTI
jgi:hypothetical protein